MGVGKGFDTILLLEWLGYFLRNVAVESVDPFSVYMQELHSWFGNHISKLFEVCSGLHVRQQ